jgi:hypothetical protein
MAAFVKLLKEMQSTRARTTIHTMKKSTLILFKTFETIASFLFWTTNFELFVQMLNIAVH